MRLASLLILALLAPGNAVADEPRGCDAFKWPLRREAEAFAHPDRAVLASGESATVSERAIVVRLAPLPEAGLPSPPERASRTADARAGFLRFAPVTPGLYQVTLTGAAWIDLVQDGRFLKPVAFSGVLDCRTVRKSVRFELGAAPFVVQVSGVSEPEIGLMVGPAPR